MPDIIHEFFFGVYPYIALAIMVIGSILRYDREPYSWRSGSSQLLRRRQLIWGSVLFHVGIIFLFFGHAVGLLTPHFIYEHFISAENKQLLAIVAGSIRDQQGLPIQHTDKTRRVPSRADICTPVTGLRTNAQEGRKGDKVTCVLIKVIQALLHRDLMRRWIKRAQVIL